MIFTRISFMLSAKNFGFEANKKSFPSMPHFVSEINMQVPITFDADCPETTPERAVKFRRVNPPRNRPDAHGA